MPGGEFWPEYLRRYHTSDAELARVASEVKPGLLVLTHVLRLGGADEEIVRNIREAGYGGPVVVAKDLDRFTPGAALRAGDAPSATAGGPLASTRNRPGTR